MATSPTVPQIFLAALRLGCTSFGGPIAHLGYFRRDYVERRRWISEQEFADLVALCQFLPGPASSQTGFGLGYQWRGWAGGLAAWLGFTLPSALLMIGFALGLDRLDPGSARWLHGLKLAAVAVVAHAVLAMWRSLAGDALRSLLVLSSAAALLVLPSAWSQIGVIAVGAAVGLLLFRQSNSPTAAPGRPASTPWPRRALLPLGVFFLLLVALPASLRITQNWPVASADTFYRSGALVFGGGHVVLPLLERELVAPGGVTADQFLAGYGAAQAVPGPLFTFAAYLGTVQHGVAGGLWAIAWVFLPGLLLVAAAQPLWQRLRHHARAQAAMRGANAVVVGVLLAALITPVGRAALVDWPSGAIALAAFAALQFTRTPSWLVVLACAALGAVLV